MCALISVQLFFLLHIIRRKKIKYSPQIASDVSAGGEGQGGGVKGGGSGVVSQRGGWINGPVWRRKGQQSAIDMFNKLALMTAGVIVKSGSGGQLVIWRLTDTILLRVLISPFPHNGIRGTPGK